MYHIKRLFSSTCILLVVCTIILWIPSSGFCELPGKVVSVSWLVDNLDNPNLLILDARLSPQEYRFGHIPHSVCAFARWRQKLNGIPFMLPPLKYMQEKLRKFGLTEKSDVVVYADGHSLSGIAWACRVAWTIEVLGHDSVAILDGGISQWEYEGRPLERKAFVPPEGDFVPDLDVTRLATLEDVRYLNATLLDLRVPERYFGVEKSRSVPKFGHIPGSLCLPAEWLLSDKIPKLIKPVEEIEKIVSGAGVSEDKNSEIIVLCDTGHFASLGYWVMRYMLGYKKVRLYDGSMVEYTRFPLPLVRYAWPASAGAIPQVVTPVVPVVPEVKPPAAPAQPEFTIEEDEGC